MVNRASVEAGKEFQRSRQKTNKQSEFSVLLYEQAGGMGIWFTAIRICRESLRAENAMSLIVHIMKCVKNIFISRLFKNFLSFYCYELGE